MKNKKKSSFSGLMSFFKKNESISQEDKIPKEENIEKPQMVPSTNNNRVEKKEQDLLYDKVVKSTKTAVGLWEYPPFSLLNEDKNKTRSPDQIKKIAAVIEQTAVVFGIGAKVIEANLLPFYDQFILELASSNDTPKIYNLTDEFAYALDTLSDKVKILKYTNDQKKDLMAIEVVSDYPIAPSLKSILSSNIININRSKLAVGLGLDASARPVVVDIAQLPHLLITGTTDYGIFNLVHSVISTLLFRASPAEVKFILIDLKRIELTGYNGIPHLMTPVIFGVEKVLASLKWAMDEMDRRFEAFGERGVRNIESYNKLAGYQTFPYIVIIIDGIEDIMAFAPVEVEDAIIRLVQMAGLAGIHLILASKESKDSQIKRMFNLFSSRIIVNKSSRAADDVPTSEYALTYFLPDEIKPLHLNSIVVSEDEIKKLVEFLESKNPPIEYKELMEESQSLVLKKATGSTGSDGRDALFEEAIRTVCQYDRASAALLQRRLSVGYSRAARILDQLEAAGVVRHAEGSTPRDVLAKNADEIISSLHRKG